MVEIVAGWKPDGDDAAAHRRWAHDLWQSLAPFALPGGSANLLGPDNREQAAGAYGGMLPGSGPSSGALIPMASSRPPFRCRSCLKHNRTLLPWAAVEPVFARSRRPRFFAPYWEESPMTTLLDMMVGDQQRPSSDVIADNQM
jgi:hypothetical protein